MIGDALMPREITRYWIAVIGAALVICVAVAMFGVQPLVVDRLGYALPGPHGRLPSPIRNAGWSYETNNTLPCRSKNYILKRVFDARHEAWPLIRTGEIPVFLGFGLSYRIECPSTSAGWTPMVLLVRRTQTCYQVYQVEGSPN